MTRVLRNLETSCPPPSNQWGFLPGISTTSALLSATYDWFTQIEAGNEVAAVFFYLTKAFDSVPHSLLLSKLEDSGLEPYTLKWISDYLTNRSQSQWHLIPKPACDIWCPPGFCCGASSFSYICQ